MPSKPLKPCSYLRCPNLTRERYCEEHKPNIIEDKSVANKQYDQYKRDKQSTSFYKSKQWKELRDYIFHKQHGLCQVCLKDNRLVSGDVVDHITPIKLDWSKRLDESNLQVLCHRCHNRKTAAEKR